MRFNEYDRFELFDWTELLTHSNTATHDWLHAGIAISTSDLDKQLGITAQE